MLLRAQQGQQPPKDSGSGDVYKRATLGLHYYYYYYLTIPAHTGVQNWTYAQNKTLRGLFRSSWNASCVVGFANAFTMID
jgi:hypothetical protein